MSFCICIVFFIHLEGRIVLLKIQTESLSVSKNKILTILNITHSQIL